MSPLSTAAFLNFLVSEIWSDCSPTRMLFNFSPSYIPDKSAKTLVLIKCSTCLTLQTNLQLYSLHS